VISPPAATCSARDLGKSLGFDVWIASNDRSRTVTPAFRRHEERRAAGTTVVPKARSSIRTMPE